MGEYCGLMIRNHEIFWSKNEPLEFLWDIFSPDEFRRFRNRYSDDGDQILGQLKTTARKMKSRLEILGYTRERAIHDFEYAKDREITIAKRHAKSSHLSNVWKNQIKILKRLTFNQYLLDLEWYLDNAKSTAKTTEFQIESPSTYRDLISQSLGQSISNSLNFLENDAFAFLRTFCEFLNDKDEISIDYTSLIFGGYLEASGNPIKKHHDEKAKIIILVEGSTDAFAINTALQILRPEIQHYFSIMDFNTSSAQGGASFLVHTMKSFIGARIPSKVIAIFDNDVAGYQGLEQLLKIGLPHNMHAMTYPRLDIAMSYNCIGPNGIEISDINGQACSIELYLGDDVIKDNESYFPIRWSAFDSRTKKWQGEIVEKQKIHEKFRQKVFAYRNVKSRSNQDWRGLNLVMDSITNDAQKLSAL